MEPLIASVVFCSGWLVPALALWAITALYSQCSGNQCQVTQLLYFGTLLLIAFITIRTVTSNDSCWLVHTASLGVMIVAGAMRRPVIDDCLATGDATLRA